MPIEARNMSKATSFDRLKLALVGDQKAGKSRCAATGRTPILFLDFDKRAEAIAGRKDVYALTFTDTEYPNQPTGYSELLKIIANIEKSRRLKDIHPDLASDANAEVEIKTLVFDSISTMSKMVMDYAKYVNKDLRREISMGPTKIFLSNGWDTWNVDTVETERLILRTLAIPNLDIIIIFHEEHKDGRLGVYPARHTGLVKYFNEVWRLTRKQQVPIAQLQPTSEFLTATNLIGAAPSITNPNIAEMIEKYGGGKI